MQSIDFKRRAELMKLIPDHVEAWRNGDREPLIKLRIELGSRQWHIEHDDKRGMSIGEGNYFNRKVWIVNPSEREFYTNHRSHRTLVKSYVLEFGAYGGTHLLVYTDGLEDALEQCAGWLADHAPGHIMVHGSDEHITLIKEACEENGLTYDGLRDQDEQRFYEMCEQAEQDLTYTESGFLTSHEWFISLENPDTETLYRFIHGE